MRRTFCGIEATIQVLKNMEIYPNGHIRQEGKEVYVFYAYAYTDSWQDINKKKKSILEN